MRTATILLALCGCSNECFIDGPGCSNETSPGSEFVAIAAGTFHTCAERERGPITCWGTDRSGSIAAVPTSGVFSQVVVGELHTCAVDFAFRQAKCWGDPALPQTNPLPDAYPTRLSAGRFHTCGDDQPLPTARCWGDDTFGQTSMPEGGFTSLAAGGEHTCVASGGRVMCWGRNDHGQASAPSLGDQQLTAGDEHSCAFTSESAVICWGRSPAADAPDDVFVQLSAGGAHTCGIRVDGTVGCWGDDSDGQSSPPAGTFRAIDAGARHTCGITTAGGILCWGNDDYGQSSPP